MDNLRIIEGYYRNIDRGKLREIVSIFSEDALYERGTRFRLKSRNEIKDFYENQRTLSGKHQLKSLTQDGDEVRVEGKFTGTSNGEPIETAFTDQWVFNSQSEVRYRRSWIEKDGI